MADVSLHVDGWPHAHFRRHAGFGQTAWLRLLRVGDESGVALLVRASPRDLGRRRTELYRAAGPGS